MGMITCTSQGYYSKVKRGNVWTAQGISKRPVAEAVVAKAGSETQVFGLLLSQPQGESSEPGRPGEEAGVSILTARDWR